MPAISLDELEQMDISVRPCGWGWHRPECKYQTEERTVQAYCVKDKTKVEIKDPVAVTMSNGKPATKGQCPTCGGNVYRIGSGK